MINNDLGALVEAYRAQIGNAMANAAQQSNNRVQIAPPGSYSVGGDIYYGDLDKWNTNPGQSHTLMGYGVPGELMTRQQIENDWREREMATLHDMIESMPYGDFRRT